MDEQTSYGYDPANRGDDETPPAPNIDGHTPEVRDQGACGGCYHCGSREEWWACAKCGEEWPCPAAAAG